MERESSNPSFWEYSNLEKNLYVNAQFSQQARLLNRIKRCAIFKEDCLAALRMIAIEDCSEDERNIFH